MLIYMPRAMIKFGSCLMLISTSRARIRLGTWLMIISMSRLGNCLMLIYMSRARIRLPKQWISLGIPHQTTARHFIANKSDALVPYVASVTKARKRKLSITEEKQLSLFSNPHFPHSVIKRYPQDVSLTIYN